MERKLWDALYDLVMAVDYDCPAAGVVHADRTIALVYLWAALHDRPTCWAVDPAHWPDALRPARLPSQATMSRRLRSRPVRHLLAAALRALRGRAAGWLTFLDTKPLPVGGWSKDGDARRGRGANGWIVGYKLHAAWAPGDAVPRAYEVLPADRGDPTTARVLVPRLGGGGYLVADSNFDSNPLHEVAARRGFQVVAPAKKRDRGLGHRRHRPERLHALEMLARPFGAALYATRAAVERDFGNLTSFGGGLGPLPAWVRHRHRVRLWVQAKLIINGLRHRLLHPNAAS